MNKKLLCCALLGALGVANAAMAQDFDDRWYLTGTAAHVKYDSARYTDSDWLVGLGLGKFLSQNWSIDAELDYMNPQQDGAQLNWSQYSLAFTGRYHFRDEGANWWPYLAAGLGAQRHEQEFRNVRGGQPLQREGTNLLAKIGAGVQADYERIGMRAEIGGRIDFDDGHPSGESSFWDTYAGVTMLVKLGSRDVAPPPAAPEPPPAPVTTCADLDDDGDGVNNCDDKCPNSQAGQAIGPDGCPVPVTIDLRGVNFDFDKSVLRPDAVAILSEAVEILKRYPELRVEVAGHTDSVGTEPYNQKLSERRAQAVYDYLTGNGIDASRLVGPNGFGELRPIDTNDTAEGRARNRRTELNVQN